MYFQGVCEVYIVKKKTQPAKTNCSFCIGQPINNIRPPNAMAIEGGLLATIWIIASTNVICFHPTKSPIKDNLRNIIE